MVEERQAFPDELEKLGLKENKESNPLSEDENQPGYEPMLKSYEDFVSSYVNLVEK